MTTPEVANLTAQGYVPMNYYLNNPELKQVLDFMNTSTIAGKSFADISGALLRNDPYMVLADFADYRATQQKAERMYQDKEAWNRMALANIANAGIFAADRSINEYAANIWHTTKAKNNPRIH